MSENILVRAATPGDADGAAPLIHAAGPALYERAFGPTREEATRFFQTLFALPDSLFSFQNGVVAVQDGQIVGLALSIPASLYHRGLDVPRQLLRRGPRFLLRLLPTAFDLRHSTQAPPADAYYLGILAVVSHLRGQGIGTALLAEVHARAAQAGCRSICLHAERDNDGARRFYERCGYRVTHDRPTPRAARWGVTGFVGMR